MKKFVLALFLLPVVLLAAGAKPNPAEPPAYEILVTVTPVEDSQFQLLPHQWRNAFRCSATVVDAETGAPRMSVSTVVQPGRHATETKTVNGMTILFGVRIADDREGAATEVVLKRGDRMLLRQRSTTRFTPMSRGR